MKKTAAQIDYTFELLKNWGALNDLTDREKTAIKQHLKEIAASCIMEILNDQTDLLLIKYNNIR